MINLTTLGLMDAQHAINTLRAEHDPLTSTPLETFLLDWVERLTDIHARHALVIAAVDEHEINDSEMEALGEALGSGIGIADLTAIVRVVEEFNATEPAQLRAKLERADKFYDIAHEAGDVFTRLNDLMTSTL